MIEEILLEYLKGVLNVPVALEHFEDEPPGFVIFEKVGSAKRNCLHSSSFAFQSYGKSLYEAARLNVCLIEAMEKAIELPQISKVQLDSDYNYTDTDLKKYRYQAVFDIHHY